MKACEKPLATPVQAGSSAEPDPCIARQPILTAEETVIGYELFFREDHEQRHFSANADSATPATIDMLNFVGLGVLCDGRLAFINCTRQVRLSDYFGLLSPSDVVIEIQANVPPDDDVIRASS
jgi:EAL and modified HD-GYP domain-containing signal transduction protein